MHDLVVRGGLVVDGTGAPARHADVAVTDGIVVEVGPEVGRGRQEIDADGAVVTPGFVDVHTHYDGQVTWDPALTPSCWHGVTTTVFGNCGVGFAPVAPERHDWLIGLMEGVEDIPGAALSAGIRWSWESFPEYLDTLDGLPLVLDVGAQVPHGAVRAYVMGERGAANEPASAGDIEAMAAIVREGLLAGALGFTTSRTLAHRAIDGEPVPGTFAAEAELFGIGAVLGELGTGVFELAPAGALGEDLAAPDREVDWMVRLSRSTGRPVSFALTQNNAEPTQWRRLLDLVGAANGAGANVRPQVHGRTVSLLLGLQTFHALQFTSGWNEIGLGLLGWREQAERLRDPQVRNVVLRDVASLDADPIVMGFMDPARTYLLGDPPNYEPGPERSVLGLAAAEERNHWEVLYDLLLGDDGRELLNAPVLNYSDGNLDAAHAMLTDPWTVVGLGDGGAHANQTCDASTPTFVLTHWVNGRDGHRLELTDAVRRMTSATADLYGLGDRGRLVPGMVGDVNVIDLDRLRLRRPERVEDLPGGAGRLVQRSEGYVATVKSGVVTVLDGVLTGEEPGRLLRGAR
ncbi:MAG: amidohydrolase family protein [Actinobacteria bacterium]|nr:amidohydrolase family protein [Actinomycetota bacterium]